MSPEPKSSFYGCLGLFLGLAGFVQLPGIRIVFFMFAFPLCSGSHSSSLMSNDIISYNLGTAFFAVIYFTIIAALIGLYKNKKRKKSQAEISSNENVTGDK